MSDSKSMMCVTSEWAKKPSFRMIPINNSCPYVECIFDVESKVLAVIGNVKKNVFHMVPKLDANGEVEFKKPTAAKNPSKPYKEERRLVETFQEYYISDSEEIREFMNMFSLNGEKYYSLYVVNKNNEEVGEDSPKDLGAFAAI